MNDEHERARAEHPDERRERVHDPETEYASTREWSVIPGNLFARAREARRILRDARRRIGLVGGLVFVDAALDQTERLLPGLMDRPEDEVTRAVRRLTPSDRAALRVALVCQLDVGDDALRALGVTARRAISVIDHVDVYDAIVGDVLALLRAFEEGCARAC